MTGHSSVIFFDWELFSNGGENGQLISDFFVRFNSLQITKHKSAQDKMNPNRIMPKSILRLRQMAKWRPIYVHTVEEQMLFSASYTKWKKNEYFLSESTFYKGVQADVGLWSLETNIKYLLSRQC